jgi:hypothetical protein
MELKALLINLKPTNCQGCSIPKAKCNEWCKTDNLICPKGVEDIMSQVSKEGYGKMVACPDYNNLCADTCNHKIGDIEGCYSSQGADESYIDPVIFEPIK